MLCHSSRRSRRSRRRTHGMKSLLRKLAAGGLVLGGVHGGLCAASVAHSCSDAQKAAAGDALPSTSSESAKRNPACEDCSPGVALGRAITKLWLKGVMDSPMFAEDAYFEDPFARFAGRDEVAEAFRVAVVFRGGTQVSPARVVANPENPAQLTVHLHHKYRFFTKDVDMYSEVLVGLDQMGRVESMEWRWFGTPLMTAVPVRLARAINGWASFQITPHIVRTHSSS